MAFRTPEFWYQSRGVLPLLLGPLGSAYGIAGRLRRKMATPAACGVPVICVGNVVAGGAGKTPTALHVAERCRRAGIDVHFLSRGYGGREKGPLRVDPETHTAADVGDEPLLLAGAAAAWISADRLAGARAGQPVGGNPGRRGARQEQRFVADIRRRMGFRVDAQGALFPPAIAAAEKVDVDPGPPAPFGNMERGRRFSRTPGDHIADANDRDAARRRCRHLPPQASRDAVGRPQWTQ